MNWKSKMIVRSHRVAGLFWTFEVDDEAVFKRNVFLLGLVISLGILVLALPEITNGQKLITSAVIFSSAAIISGRLKARMHRAPAIQETAAARRLVVWTDAIAVMLILFWCGIAWMLFEAIRSVLVP